MKTIGVYWGRFNPPHHAHIDMLEAILKHVDKLIIVIGSSQLHDEKRNPFNGKERLLMMRALLKERHVPLNRIKIITVETDVDYYSSVKKLIAACPSFDLIFTDKKIALRMFKRISPRIKQGHFKCKVEFHATHLRNAIANDRSWEHFTGKSVVRLIKKLNGVERIKLAYGIRSRVKSI